MLRRYLSIIGGTVGVVIVRGNYYICGEINLNINLDDTLCCLGNEESLILYILGIFCIL